MVWCSAKSAVKLNHPSGIDWVVKHDRRVEMALHRTFQIETKSKRIFSVLAKLGNAQVKEML
jgi:hypothetical protein